MTTTSRSTGVLGWILVLASVVGVWAMAVVLTVPVAMGPGGGDYGFFTAVAERLRAGDRLYADVWDNKDPLVFYSIALARTLGPVGAWILELGWVLVCSVSLYAIARFGDLGRRSSVFIAGALGPVIVLGFPYFMGSTHLPGVALTLLATALFLRHRTTWSGLAVGILVFVKFVMLPLALAVIVATAIRTDGRRAPRALRPFAFGLGGTIAAVALVMLVRGELWGFIETQQHNILYSQSPIVSAAYTSLYQKVGQHIVILVNTHILVIWLTSGAIALFASWSHRRAGSNRSWLDQSVLWWAASTALVAAVASIAITGKWIHHAEILAVSSLLFMVVLATTLRTSWRWPSWISLALVAAITIPLAGLVPLSTYRDALSTFTLNWQKANQTDPLTEILLQRVPTSVAFVGWGNLVPRTKELPGWTVACRHIAQRPFNPKIIFDETIECLPSAELIVITNDYGRDPAFPEYTAFVDSVEALVDQQYTCTQVPNFRLCERAN